MKTHVSASDAQTFCSIFFNAEQKTPNSNVESWTLGTYFRKGAIILYSVSTFPLLISVNFPFSILFFNGER
ncbi:hypothetical protein BH09BAC3_BH09BAC3_02840 [soil metagenome]